MGKKVKIGKQRKDKYYQLAKETGYRSRAAFKLIQLNRKFEFLQKSRVCIDLCAAPGGWMQVARQNMPVSSIVIGVDLFPIKPIPGCISITEDITTDKCRVAISRELKTWKADVVLNDGAPNIGTNWLYDAFQQTSLTLSAVKLATHFLKKGGWFISKLFRSRDYNALLWVLQQLFSKVNATKPQASRNESAEIFIICQGYKAPDKIDPKFFDPKYVFSELDVDSSNKLNIYHPERKKRKATGYPENDYTCHQELSAKKFIAHTTGVELLEEASEIIIDDEQIENHPKTTNEVKECCKDIKVLNKKDLKLIMNWWKTLHNEFYAKPTEDEENKDTAPAENQDNSEDEEEKEEKEIETAIYELKEEQRRELKKKKKKVEKDRKKLVEKMNLKMVHKGDEGPRLDDGDEMFSLREIKTHEILNEIVDQTPDVVVDSESDSDERVQKRRKKVKYDKEEGYLDESGLYYKNDESDESESDSDNDDMSIQSSASDSETDKENKSTKSNKKKVKFDIDDIEEPINPLLKTESDLSNNKNIKKINKAKLWFERDSFKNLEEDNSEQHITDDLVKNNNKKNKKNPKKELVNQNGLDESDSDYNVEEEFLSEKRKKNEINQKCKIEDNNNNEDESILKETTQVQNKRKLNEEDLALGTLLIKSKKSRREIIDGAWNRYAFNDDHLPDWFVQDEQKHMKKEAPVTKELVEDYKKVMADINARPIKKVMEAKARKKKRALRKLEKAKKKVEALMDNTDISDRERADQIKRLYKQAKRQPKKKVTVVVSKKHLAQKRASRPAGVKGRYKVVDPRMKKDMRAAKRLEKKRSKGSKGQRSQKKHQKK
ncbi:pre-rRNA 2'-O-ribose RNA methyltransferase FTSJ3 [Chelonus insularis]|uniref:pre-rRNA 2'-O-ribose RNA methyltransferase FTSJ3 n=1 Tax=Chelonus insularis TaxID=460826 RepID=UPI00158CF434|nr:pre-rRNA 2'-O-ribose RNA methyltransferase FTSJ3 [Chelonus insularis]